MIFLLTCLVCLGRRLRLRNQCNVVIAGLWSLVNECVLHVYYSFTHWALVYHCGWVPLRPSHSDFGQNWKPGTGEIPLLSLRLGAIEAQWYRRRLELEARHHREIHSHCGWALLRPSDSDFGQNWKPGTGEIILLSLRLGAIEAQWFRLRPELEARDRRDSPTLTAIGRHWGSVIPISVRIGSPRWGDPLYSRCGRAPLRPSDSDFG
jgi:hypothetical protein